MAHMTKKGTLPPVGSAFAFPIGDGRYAVCRVIREKTGEEVKQWGHMILVAVSAWIGPAPPRPDDPALVPILRLTHHSWNNEPKVTWTDTPPPGDFAPIGTIEPTEEDHSIRRESYSSVTAWSSLQTQPLRQWRWDHDREAVLAEDAVRDAKQKAEWEAKRKEERKRLSRTTLEDLRTRRFFAGWKGYPPPEIVRASRAIMRRTVEELLVLDQRSAKAKRMAVLKECIESFNRLDEEVGGFIETDEREDICEEFEAIVHACGLGDLEDLADDWREW